jgi:hypothetical protein
MPNHMVMTCSSQDTENDIVHYFHVSYMLCVFPKHSLIWTTFTLDTYIPLISVFILLW